MGPISQWALPHPYFAILQTLCWHSFMAIIISSCALFYVVAGIYLVLIMSMISLSLFLAIIIENLHHRRPKLNPVPKWMRTVFLKRLPKLLGIELPKVHVINSFSSSPWPNSCENHRVIRIDINRYPLSLANTSYCVCQQARIFMC